MLSEKLIELKVQKAGTESKTSYAKIWTAPTLVVQPHTKTQLQRSMSRRKQP
jgi:hypothetical protein